MRQPTDQELQTFAVKNAWGTQMSESRGLDSFKNYIGPNLGELVVVIAQNRDSEILEQSNFDSALDMLGGESETVVVERFGHWGCGWFELILVDPRDHKALKTAFEIKALIKEYPVLDESDFYERESEYFSEFAEEHKTEIAEAICLHLGFPELATDPDMIHLAYLLNIECQQYYGADSCIDIYSMREPDARDWERAIECLKQLSYSSFESDAYDLVCACLDVGGDK